VQSNEIEALKPACWARFVEDAAHAEVATMRVVVCEMCQLSLASVCAGRDATRSGSHFRISPACPCVRKSALRPLPAGPELGTRRENLSRVAASAADIKAVLLKDTGLLVETEEVGGKGCDGTWADHQRWRSVRRCHFDRLEMDTQFRSVATLLVQKYGYLVPKLNPESKQRRNTNCWCKSGENG